MRWKSLCGGLALLLAVTSGCKQRCFLTQDDFNTVQTSLTTGLEINPNVIAQPLIPPTGTPSTVIDPERKVRYISLAECISISLEQGTVGSSNGIGVQGNVVAPDTFVSFTGRGISTQLNDNIRVLALDPAILGTEIDTSLSKFDAVWTTSATWTTTDQPVATALQAFQTGSTGLTAIASQDANINTAILKPLATGGIAGVTFTVPYTFTNLPARVNPSYRPQLQFQFEQPLMQGYGVEINQLRPQLVGSLLNPTNLAFTQPTVNGTPVEGILITRIRFDEQRAEFERNVHIMLVNVEQAYWNLYGSYWTLYSRESALRQAYEAWKINKAKYEAGSATVADFAQTRGQYELFRAQRIQALNQVLESERQLRQMLGMQVEDGCRLVPSDSPTVSPYNPDWASALNDALNLSPELYLARQEVKQNQLNLILQKNSLLPDLRFTATYDINSIGSRLDGAGDTGDNALRNLASNRFNDWAMGLRLQIPIGFRQAHTNVRVARLQLSRAYEVLKDQELKRERFLAFQYRNIFSNYEQIIAQRAQREAFAEQLRARYQRYLTGKDTLDILLEAQRFWADALNNEYQAIVGYNNSLASWEFAKGTILQHDNVVISEGALPGCVQVRAVEHERERTKALVLWERAQPCLGKGCCSAEKDLPGAGPLPPEEHSSLPAVWNSMPPLKDAKMLPSAEKGPTTDPKTLAPVESKPEEVFPTVTPTSTEMPKTLPPLPTAKSAMGTKKSTTFSSLRTEDNLPSPVLPGEPIPALPPLSKQ
jgi:outer membrane protein TolC